MPPCNLHVITELFPPEETSTAYILGEMANACAGKYAVRVICGPEVYDKRRLQDAAHLFVLNPAIRVHRAKGLGVDKNRTVGKALSLLVMSFRLYRLAKRQIKDGDKVLLVTNPAPLLLLMARLRRRHRFDLTLLVHDVFPENTVPAGYSLPGCLYRRLKSRFDRAYASIDRFIVNGRDVAEVVRAKAGESAQISIVEHWADTEDIVPLPFSEGPLKLEFAGNIGRLQALDRRVAELPQEVELHIYGTGAAERALRNLHHPRVFFHGPYLRSQQTEVLGACHAAIVSLADEMCGLAVPSKAYNIMASGRPILYFGPADGEIGRLVREERIGYIGWPPCWDLAELQEMGRRARSLAETRYGKAAMLEKFMEALG